MESIKAINQRYSTLAEEGCCLSCGGAIKYAEARDGETFLDLGSGRGTDAIRLAQELGPQGRVYGLDISDGMISKAVRTAEKLAVGNVTFIQAKLEEIPLPDASVDCVISNCTINHATDKQRVWQEIFRVLNGGGRFVVSDIYATRPVPAQYAADPQAVAECWAGAVTREEYFATLRKCGFADIKVLEESSPYPKGEIEVASFTVLGRKPRTCCG